MRQLAHFRRRRGQNEPLRARYRRPYSVHFAIHPPTAIAARAADPVFDQAARPVEAEALYERFLVMLADQGLQPQRGVFGAHMQVEIHNDGPVTLMVESPQ